MPSLPSLLIFILRQLVRFLKIISVLQIISFHLVWLMICKWQGDSLYHLVSYWLFICYPEKLLDSAPQVHDTLQFRDL